MRKLYLSMTAISFSVALGVAAPAFAQSSPSGNIQQPKLQPLGDQDTPLPPALPGAGDPNLPTSQSVAKQQSGDPTTDLFTAINANDYNSAQDAISRGANLNGQNSLGETPIDLSVALNRNSITFLLLAARNDSGDGPADDAASGVPVAAAAAPPRPVPSAKSQAVPVRLIENPNAAPGNNPGTPNSSAGFLGFNH
jgi:ankyrin repeat protein